MRLPPFLARFVSLAGLDERRCPVCGEPVRGQRLCPACAAELAPRQGGYCPGCGNFYEDESEHPYFCGDCRLDPKPWREIRMFGRYDGSLKDMALAFKFGGRLGLSSLLQDLMLQAFDLRPWLETPEMIVPVPLHPHRLLWRGFNQSLELSRRLARERSLPIRSEALRRVRKTPPQSRLKTKRERQGNIRGAFAASAETIAGRRVLLVDDILTTGATLEECARALRVAGAAGVSALVLLRA